MVKKKYIPLYETSKKVLGPCYLEAQKYDYSGFFWP